MRNRTPRSVTSHCVVRGVMPFLSLAGLAACGGTGSSGSANSAEPGDSTASPATSTLPPVTTVAPECGVRLVAGPEMQMNWGSKSFGTVTATAFVDENGRLCGASATWWAELLLSDEITSEAIPVLNAEVRKAHTADVNAVSGATATSRAYVNSLQAAIDSM